MLSVVENRSGSRSTRGDFWLPPPQGELRCGSRAVPEASLDLQFNIQHAPGVVKDHALSQHGSQQELDQFPVFSNRIWSLPDQNVAEFGFPFWWWKSPVFSRNPKFSTNYDFDSTLKPLTNSWYIEIALGTISTFLRRVDPLHFEFY